MNCHVELGHGGLQTTLAMVREVVCIPAGRQVIKKALAKCVYCKKANGGPFRLPEFPQLPKVRVNASSAFSQVGIDHLGPLHFKQEGNPLKAWVLLITCLVTRAVHLEVVTSLSVIAFLNSLKRFLSRRGTPRFIISDNATTFLSAREVLTCTPLNDYQSSVELTSYLAQHSIQWHTIVARAPFQGGVWERMVQTVNKAMKATFGK
jgi:hypothetical protein